MYNLVIKSVTVYDGGKYTCGLPVADEIREANVMVLGK